MTGFSVLRSRPAGTLTTVGGASYTAGAGAFSRRRAANSRSMRV